MKVLLTALQPGGGIRTFLRYVYSQECFGDVTIDLLAPGGTLGPFLEEHIPSGRFRVKDIEPASRSLLRAARQHIAAGGYDLIHSHGFAAGAMTEIARTGYSIPHLMTAHDVFRPEQFSGIRGRLMQVALGALYRRIDRVHTVTASAGRNFTGYMPLVRAERVTNILHGVDTDYFRAGKSRDLRSELGIPKEAPTIGFFGRFMAQKGFRSLVDAMAILREQLEPQRLPRVITFGWGGFIREDYQYLGELGLSDFFYQLPATNEMPDMLKSVDMVTMPSRWEACGLLAMEALSAGVPLIGTDCVGLRDVLAGTPALVVPPESPEALAAAISQLIHEPSTEAFVEYQDAACDRFAIARPASAIRHLYSEMVSNYQSSNARTQSQGSNV